MKTHRFANILGEEYNLFNRSVPHHDEFQDKVGEINQKLRDFFESG